MCTQGMPFCGKMGSDRHFKSGLRQLQLYLLRHRSSDTANPLKHFQSSWEPTQASCKSVLW
jgi:hypothetical protein